MCLLAQRDAPLRAVLWDFDGTLVASSPIHREAFARTLAELGLAPVPYERLAGRPTLEVFADLALTGAQLEEAVQRKQGLALAGLRGQPVLFEGALEVLRECRDRGSMMALVSGASRRTIEEVGRRYQLPRFFDAVIGAGDTERGKPDPEPFLEACRRLDVFPSEALAIEDSETGVRSAAAAGIPVCVVHREGASFAERVASASDLVELRHRLHDLALRGESEDPSPVRFLARARPRPRTGRCVAVVPAAGRGTRLGHGGPKLLFEIGGAPILLHLYRQLRRVVDAIVLVVSPEGRDPIRQCAERLGLDVQLAIQPEPVGMADAVYSARRCEATERADSFLVVWGDQVTLRASTVERLMAAHTASRADISLPTRIIRDPYIHFERNRTGRLTRVLQRREGDPMPTLGENDCGVFLVRNRNCFSRLESFLQAPGERGAHTGEVSFLPFLVSSPHVSRVCCLRGIDPRETLGVNTPTEAELAGRYLQELEAAESRSS